MARSTPGFVQTALGLRLLSALVALPVLAFLLFVGGVLFAVAATVVAVVGAAEALSLLRRAGWAPLVPQGAAWAGIIVGGVAIFGWPWGSTISAFIAAVAGTAVLAAAIAKLRSTKAIGAWVFTALGVTYVALPLASIVALRPLPDGLGWLLVAFLGTFATDTGAYAVGRLLGRRRMAPSISPSKTWEGFLGGLLGGAGATVAAVWLLDLPPSPMAALAIGFALAIAGQIGDLAESKLKRLAGAKDSGALIPGHGGLLDRLDSLVAVFPLIYYVARIWPGN